MRTLEPAGHVGADPGGKRHPGADAVLPAAAANVPFQRAAGADTLKVNLPLFVIDFEKPEVSAKANPYFIAQGGQPIRGKNGVPSLGKVFAAVKLPKAPAQETVQISMSI